MLIGTCETCGYWILRADGGIACAHPANQRKRPTPIILGQYVKFCTEIIEKHGMEQGLAKVLNAIAVDGIPMDRMMGIRKPESKCEHHTSESIVPKCETPSDELALYILGGGPTKVLLPDLLALHTKCDIWTLNHDRMVGYQEYWAAHFDVHISTGIEHPDIVSRAANKDFDFWTQKNYPFDKILRPDKLHSTMCYALALVALKGYKHVYLPGVDFWGRREEDFEARGAEYRIGVLEGMGVKVWTSPVSEMMQKFVYRILTGEMTHGSQHGGDNAPVS